MLSESGPSGGLVVRPYDGDIPASVSFVQAYEEEDQDNARLYLSACSTSAMVTSGRLATLGIISRRLSIVLTWARLAYVFVGCPGSPELLLDKSIRIDYACHAEGYGIPFLKQGLGACIPLEKGPGNPLRQGTGKREVTF
jgi:hypothetical protein